MRLTAGEVRYLQAIMRCGLGTLSEDADCPDDLFEALRQMAQERLGTIAFGAWDPKLGACGSIWDIPRDPHIGHSPEVHGGVLEGECQSILTDFFAQRR